LVTIPEVQIIDRALLVAHENVEGKQVDGRERSATQDFKESGKPVPCHVRLRRRRAMMRHCEYISGCREWQKFSIWWSSPGQGRESVLMLIGVDKGGRSIERLTEKIVQQSSCNYSEAVLTALKCVARAIVELVTAEQLTRLTFWEVTTNLRQPHFPLTLTQKHKRTSLQIPHF